MQEIRILKFWKWGVVLLAICNAGLMLTIWLRPHREGPGGERPREYIIRNLKFTDAQIRAYDPLIKEHQQAMNELRKAVIPYREALYAQMKNNEAPNKVADSLAELLANNQKQIELVTFHHFERVRAICTEEQRSTFDHLIGFVLKKMNGGRPCPPPEMPHAEDQRNTGAPNENPPPEGQ